MGSIELESGLAVEPAQEIVRTHARRPPFVSEFEDDIRQLYLQMMDEPVPARLLGILRAGLSGSKT
jgi:hypothetical protein